MEHSETLTVMLPVRIKITYEFENPYRDEKLRQSKFSIDVEIFLTKDETEILDEELLNIMLKAMNTIFEARKLEHLDKTTEEAFKDVFDTDPA